MIFEKNKTLCFQVFDFVRGFASVDLRISNTLNRPIVRLGRQGNLVSLRTTVDTVGGRCDAWTSIALSALKVCIVDWLDFWLFIPLVGVDLSNKIFVYVTAPILVLSIQETVRQKSAARVLRVRPKIMFYMHYLLLLDYWRFSDVGVRAISTLVESAIPVNTVLVTQDIQI